MKLMDRVVAWFSQSGAPWRNYALAEAPRAARRPLKALGMDRLPGQVTPIAAAAIARTKGAARHPLIASSRIIGNLVFSADGRPSGQVRDLAIDKQTGRIAYVLVASGGFFGLAEKYRPLPWAMLNYDVEREGFRAPFAADYLRAAPAFKPDELEDFGAGDAVWRAKMAAQYGPYYTLPFI